MALSYRRVITDEIMDGPDVAPAAHVEALDGLRKINLASHAAENMLRPIVDMARREKLNHLSLLDVACGGGDVPAAVAAGARQSGIDVELTLLDRSPTAIATATAAATLAGIVNRGRQADVLSQSSEINIDGVFDVVTNSLFLHHIPTEDQVVGLLRKMAHLAKRMVVISDLRRSRSGFAVAWLGCRLLSKSRIVHHDGPVSVRAAWTIGELCAFASRAGMENTRIHYCWPWRMLLVWEKPRQGSPHE